MAHIGEQLLHVPQRENAGEDSESAFAFQKNWALSELLDRHLLGTDYLYIFEYHDDVLFLDSETPKSLEFIQIKKSDRVAWTITRLIKPPREATNSILGKLYLHLANFSSEQITLRFVSDMFFTFSSAKKFLASTIKDEEQKQICTQIENEIPKLKPLRLEKLTFEKCELSFERHADQLLGQIVRFVDTTFGGNTKVRPIAFYDTLQRKAERSRNSSERPSTFEQLVLRKGICRTEIDQLISDLRATEDSLVNWDDISDYMNQLAASSRERLLLKGSFRKIDAERKINSSEVLQQALDEARSAITASEIMDNAEEIVRAVETHLNKTVPDVARCFNAQESAVIAIISYCESILTLGKGPQ